MHSWALRHALVKPIAVELHRRGYRVLCPLLIGHGRSNSSRKQSLDGLVCLSKRAFEGLSKDWDEVMIVGFSMGGLIALKLAHEKGEHVKGVAALAPAYELDYLTDLKLRLVKRLGIGKLLPDVKKRTGPDVSDPDVAALMPSNDAVPVATAVSLMEEAKDRRGNCVSHRDTSMDLSKVKVTTVPAHSARRLFSQLKNTNRRLLFYPKSWHILALDVEHHEVIEDVCDYVDELYNEGPIGNRGGKHMRRLIVSIDQGTTGTTVLVLDDALNVLGRANQNLLSTFQNRDGLSMSGISMNLLPTHSETPSSRHRLLKRKLHVSASRINAKLWLCGIATPANQCIAQLSGRIEEQPGCAGLLKTTDNEALVKKRTGLLLDPYFSAPRSNGFSTKQTLERRLRRETSSVERSTVFSCNTGGQTHVTDPSNACRTLLIIWKP